jgi:predicted DCC family thiol-disulfide oxidoreductase YuxK
MPSRVPPASPPRWTVLYDRECGVCQWLLAGLLRWDRSGCLRPLALQSAQARELLAELTPEQQMASWHLISPTGQRSSAGVALAPLLRLLPGGLAPAAALARAPALAERGYRWVADHRSLLGRGVPAGAKRRAGEYVRARERR